MRSSVLSRSVVAIATLALGSAVLASVPASATTSADVTRGQVLNAAQLVRTDPGTGTGNPMESAPATSKALRVLANRACAVDHDEEVAIYNFGLPVAPGGSADGLIVMAQIIDPSEGSLQSGRVCIFGALAAAKGSTTLAGTAKLTTDAARTYRLSGDVYVTPARSFEFDYSQPEAEPPFDVQDLAFTATGTATTLTKVTTTKTIKTPKTKAQKKSAKKKYNQALASAKKSYKKALKKAGSSKSKKAAAKKAYSKKKASAKKTYQKRIATSKVTTVTTVTKTPVTFDVQAMRFPALP